MAELVTPVLRKAKLVVTLGGERCRWKKKGKVPLPVKLLQLNTILVRSELDLDTPGAGPTGGSVDNSAVERSETEDLS